MRKGKFIIRKTKDGQFYWVLNGKNGRQLCSSQKTYNRKAGANAGIDAVFNVFSQKEIEVVDET